MNRYARAIVVLVLASLVTSCTTMPPFTTELRQRYGLESDRIEQVQFYISERVVLQRRLTGAEAGSMTEVTSGHTLRRVEGEYVEEIVIEPRTPCVVIDADTGGPGLRVAFEPGAYLVFGPVQTSAYGRIAGRYYLHGTDWRVVDSDGSGSRTVHGTVVYAGKPYVIVSPRGYQAYLVVDEETLRTSAGESRTLPGIELD